MAFSFTCPECRSKLKTATAIPAGKTVQCPKCKKVFTMPEDAADEDAPSPAPARSAAAARAPSRNADAEAAPRKRGSDFDFDDEGEAPRSRRKTRDEDEEEAPRARKSRDDDEDEAPRSRRKPRDEEDEEETPRSRRKGRDEEDEEESPKPRRKSRVDDEEEEAPKARRKGRDDEDEDEAPKSRRRRTDDEDEEESPKSRRKGRDEDEDEDDRPRSRGKANKKKKKGNPALMIALVGGALAGIGGLAFLLYYLFSGGSGADKELLAFAPKDTAVLIGADIEGLMDQPKVKDQLNTFLNSGQGKPVVDGLAKVGLQPTDFSKLLVAMPNPNKPAGKGGKSAEPPAVVVVRLKSGSSLDKDKVASGLGGTKQEQNGKTYYKLADKNFQGPGFLYMPTDKLLVFATTEQAMKDVLGKDDKEVVLGEDMQALAKKAGGGHFWAAASATLLDGGMRNMAGQFAAGDLQPLGELVKKAKGGAFWMNTSSSTVDINVAVLADSDSASSAASALQKKFDETKDKMGQMAPPDAKAAMDSIKIRSSGDMMVVSLSIDMNALEQLSKMGGGMPFPGMGGGFGPGPGPRPNPRPKR